MLALLSMILVGVNIAAVDCLDCWQNNLSGSSTPLTYENYITTGSSQSGCGQQCELQFALDGGVIKLIAGKCSSDCDDASSFFRKYCCTTNDCNKQIILTGETAQTELVANIVDIISALTQIQCDKNSKPTKEEFDALVTAYNTNYNGMLGEDLSDVDMLDLSDVDMLIILANPNIQSVSSSLLECFSCQDVTDESECTETEICRPGEQCGSKVCKGCSSKSSRRNDFILFTKGCQSASTCEDLEEEFPNSDDVTFCCDTDKCNEITMTEMEGRRRKRSYNNKSKQNKRKNTNGKKRSKSMRSGSKSSSKSMECDLDQDTDANDAQCTVYEDLLKLVENDKLTEAYNALFDTGDTTEWCSITSDALTNFGTDSTDPLYDVFSDWNQWVCPENA